MGVKLVLDVTKRAKKEYVKYIIHSKSECDMELQKSIEQARCEVC